MKLIHFPKVISKPSDKDYVAELKEWNEFLRKDKIESAKRMTCFLGLSVFVLVSSFFMFVSLSGYLANLFKG